MKIFHGIKTITGTRCPGTGIAATPPGITGAVMDEVNGIDMTTRENPELRWINILSVL
jgi:hypothetical protein